MFVDHPRDFWICVSRKMKNHLPKEYKSKKVKKKKKIHQAQAFWDFQESFLKVLAIFKNFREFQGKWPS